MRHRNHKARLGMPYGPRKALLRSLVVAILENEKIRTTVTRAAEMERHAEKMITLARDGSQTARRAAFAYLQDKEIVHRLFEVIGPRFKDRPGGYLRTIKADRRQGDGAEMAIVEFVDREIKIIDEKEADKKKSRAQRMREMRRAYAKNLRRQ